MSYAGKFVGQNVGSWLGPVQSDPNAIYASLFGAGALTATLTGVEDSQRFYIGTKPPKRSPHPVRHDDLTPELHEAAHDLLEMIRRNADEQDQAALDRMRAPAKEPRRIVVEPAEPEQPRERAFMVRIPGAQPSRVVIPEGAEVSKNTMLALLLALSELDD